jgi:thiamine-monophosphate kinase
MEKETSKRTEIADLGEFGLIDKLTESTQRYQASTIKGVGDDSAVIASGDKLMLITTDMLLEGIHFDLMYTPLKHLGYKAVISNLSDIYAMNGQPRQITVSIGLSNRFSFEAVEEIYRGIHLACQMYKVDLVGGDTASSLHGLFISVTAIGEVSKDKIVYRSGANVGDILCASGDFGASYLGLQILEREKQIFLDNQDVQPELEDAPYLIERQLKPEARKDSIEYFEKVKLVPTAMIDVSDGLASDFFHICKQSGVGGFIEEAKVPVHRETEEMALKFRLDPISCALSGGEDYELLFTVTPDDLEKVRYMPDAAIIGEIQEAKDGVKLHSSAGKIHPLKAQGWQHFQPIKGK